MKIGLIGAGKVGCSLGKYFVFHGLEVNGYFDKEEDLAKEAALFTGTKSYEHMSDLVAESDTLFLTVPDGIIASVWEAVKQQPINHKNICHCSGALSADSAFSGIRETGAFGYSIHPLFAVSDKYHSYKELSTAFFTIEGQEEHLELLKQMLEGLGNQVQRIYAEQKTQYHAAAVICSNHVIALIKESVDLLIACGFSEPFARKALTPLMLENMKHVITEGPKDSLTGPVERNDSSTIRKHLSCLEKEEQMLYCLLSKQLISIGKQKHPDQDYTDLLQLLDKTLYENRQKTEG